MLRLRPTIEPPPAVLAGVKGAMLIGVDHEGRVVWYEDTAATLELEVALPANGSQYIAESNSVVAVLGHDRIVEVSAQGELLVSLIRDVHFGGAVHHDVTKYNGKIHALFADEYTFGGETWILDGVYVFEGEALIAEWSLFGVADFSDWTPPGAGYWGLEFDLGVDISHANGIMVNEDGSIVLSLRHLHTVMEIEGSESPAFGEVHWSVVGQPTDGVPIESTYTPTSLAHLMPVDFSVQHHASITQDGTLIFLDNRENPTVNSRVVEWRLDPAAGIADLIQEYDTGEWCVVQGGVYELPSGNLLATCATSQTVYEFGRDGTLLWTFEPDCGGFLFSSLIRASPAGW